MLPGFPACTEKTVFDNLAESHLRVLAEIQVLVFVAAGSVKVFSLFRMVHDLCYIIRASVSIGQDRQTDNHPHPNPSSILVLRQRLEIPKAGLPCPERGSDLSFMKTWFMAKVFIVPVFPLSVPAAAAIAMHTATCSRGTTSS